MSQCHDSLRRPKISKNMKNFHICDDFSKTIIIANMVGFNIAFARSNDISINKRWMDNLDWLEEISRLKNLNLNSFEVQTLWS